MEELLMPQSQTRVPEEIFTHLLNLFKLIAKKYPEINDGFPVDIDELIILGDSLSDADNLSALMQLIAGLGKSPRGNFTNGLVWNQHLGADIANRTMLDEIRKAYRWDNTDIADAILSEEHHLPEKIRKSYSFDSPGVVNIKPLSSRKLKTNYTNLADMADDIIAKKKGARELASDYTLKIREDFIQGEGGTFKKVKRTKASAKPVTIVKNFALGGATAHNYKWAWIANIKLFFTRIFVSNLDEERAQLIDYDKKNKVTNHDKKAVLNWIGANDFFTVNSEPTHEIAEKAVMARIKNIKLLIENEEYVNFIEVNLPGLELTPDYQNRTGKKGQQQRDNVKDCCIYFNQRLAEEILKLKIKYPRCNFKLIDAYTMFEEIYKHSENYGFDKDKLTKPYTESQEFELDKKKKTSPATGFLFWDRVHPSADLSALMSQFFLMFIDLFYRFKVSFHDNTISKEHLAKSLIAPEEIKKTSQSLTESELIALFRETYERQLQEDKVFGLHNSKLDYQNSNLTLVDILKHGTMSNSNRTNKVLKKLGWINEKNEINLMMRGLWAASRELHKQDHRVLSFKPQANPKDKPALIKKADLPNLSEEKLRDFIMKKYNQQLSADMNGWFKFFREKELPANPSLEDIVRHALGKDNRTSQLMKAYGLLKSDNQLNQDIEAFKPFLEAQAQAPGVVA